MCYEVYVIMQVKVPKLRVVSRTLCSGGGHVCPYLSLPNYNQARNQLLVLHDVASVRVVKCCTSKKLRKLSWALAHWTLCETSHYCVRFELDRLSSITI